MNFVIFSYYFLPANDAEGFCGARFASALADAGHRVHVVTMDWPQTVDAETCQKLLRPEVQVTRVPFSHPRFPIYPRVRYLSSEGEAVDIPRCIKAVNEILSKTRDAILISRGLPILSNIVGWYCRKRAKLWVAHFSDPFPLEQKPKELVARLTHAAARFWGRRCIRDAGLVSLTCKEAERFFVEEYADVWNHSKSCITTHIGDPWLPAKTPYPKGGSLRIISHVGTLGRSRCLKMLSDALDIVRTKRNDVTFLQAGQLKKVDMGLFATKIDHEIFPEASPDLTTAIVEASSVSLIIDSKTYLPYIPFLPSKFTYQVFTDVPIVIVSQEGSAMHRYWKTYRDAGLYFAENSSAEKIASVILETLDSGDRQYNRVALRNEFSERMAVKGLMEKIGEMRF